MSVHTSQNYYLVNLSTRNVSVSTHLRGDNYTLKSGKCIYLGNLTDELILKYHKYAALNISLRIVTKDKLESILNKSINLNNEQINAILNESGVRKEHPAGSIAETRFNNIQRQESYLSYSKDNSIKQSSNLFTKVLPTKNCSVQPQQHSDQQPEKKVTSQPVAEKHEVHHEHHVYHQEHTNDSKLDERKHSDVNVSENLETFDSVESEPISEPVKEDSTNANIVEVTEESVNEQPLQSEIYEQHECEQKIVSDSAVQAEEPIQEEHDESDIAVKEYNVVEESIKQDVKDMSYNQLYDLVKARNLLSGGKGRPSKAKLIELLSNDLQ